jgi:hypothetical protein
MFCVYPINIIHLEQAFTNVWFLDFNKYDEVGDRYDKQASDWTFSVSITSPSVNMPFSTHALKIKYKWLENIPMLKLFKMGQRLGRYTPSKFGE